MALLDRLRSLFSRKTYAVPTASGGWYPIVREPFAGAWQRNMEINNNRVSTFHADFACKTLIARDIAKLPIRLMAKDSAGIWNEVNNPAFSPVLRKPNSFQTRNQFWESWMLSKLSRGNTYVLKARDNRRVVTGLHIMNPDRVTVKVAEDSSVFYQLATDDMQQYEGTITVPQTEIIHDRMNPLYHPLVGVPPIYASALAATQGLNIQSQSLRLFANNAQPGGLLIAPSEISPENAERLRKTWQEMYSGDNFGKIAVLGNAMKYEKLAQTADEAQLIEQLKWTAEVVCSTYHVPPYKIGVGAMPSYNNVQALNVEYYTQCLQCLIEDAESTLDDGLGLGDEFSLRTEFDIDNLLRMDGTAQADRAAKLVAGSIQTPNEARRDFGLSPLAGGDTVYMQQQNYSLEALAKRDAQADPFASKAPATPTPPADDSTLTPVDGKALAHELRKALRLPIAA